MDPAVLPHLPLSDIAVFLDVVRSGNYTATAKSLYMSQPQVSKRMRSMESELGIQLVEHQGRKIVPTPAGKILYERLAPLYSGMIDAIELAGSATHESAYTVRIGFAEWDSIHYMAQLAHYEKLHPHVTLEVGSYPFRELLTGLWDKQMDLIVTTEYGARSYPEERFMREPCGSMQAYAFMSKEDELAQRDSVELSDLVGRKLITPSFEMSSSYYEFLGKISMQIGHMPPVLLHSSNKGTIAWHILKEKALYIMSTEFIVWGIGSGIRRVPINGLTVGMMGLWRKDSDADTLRRLVKFMAH